MSLFLSTITGGVHAGDAWRKEQCKLYLNLEAQLKRIDDEISMVHNSDYLHVNDIAMNVWAERALYSLRNERSRIARQIGEIDHTMSLDGGKDWLKRYRR